MKKIGDNTFELVCETDPVIINVMGYPKIRKCTGCVARDNKPLCDKLGLKCLNKEFFVWRLVHLV